jgi:hypothetical protein
MKRLEDWPERLHEMFMAHKDKPFEWGSHDCVLSVCAAIEAMTGVDPAKEFRGRYSTEIGAVRAIKGAGHPSFEAMVSAIAADHDMKEIGPKFAQRGDMVLIDVERAPVFGIVHHNGRDAICVAPDGLRRLPVLSARRAWRVG